MPIEIKELVIRAVVDEERRSSSRQEPDADARRRIVDECVEQVLDILRLKQER